MDKQTLDDSMDRTLLRIKGLEKLLEKTKLSDGVALHSIAARSIAILAFLNTIDPRDHQVSRREKIQELHSRLDKTRFQDGIELYSIGSEATKFAARLFRDLSEQLEITRC